MTARHSNPNHDIWTRIILLLTEIVCFRSAMYPPNSPPSKGERDEYAVKHSVLDSMPVDVVWMAWAWRTLVYTTTTIEILALLPLLLPSCTPPSLTTPLNIILPPPPPHHTIHTTPLTILTHTLLLAGTSLRLHCYTLLSRSFTYELSLRPDHRLITDGPYAIVRHPSYTGILCLILGNLGVNFGRGGWWGWMLRLNLSEISGLGGGGAGVGGWIVWVMGVVYKAIGMANLLYLLPLPYIFVKRCVAEDKVMKGHFKEEWERWREKVLYRLVPYVW